MIGIGIVNPDTLKLHRDCSQKVLKRSEWFDFYADLVGKLLDQGFCVELFTNGARDDFDFAKFVFDAIKKLNHDSVELVSLSAQLTTPKELALTIAKYDGLVAHRLHANIIAFSYGVPHVGLGWNSKMEGYFAETGRKEFLLRPVSSVCAAQASQILTKALEKGIDSEQILSIKHDIHAQTLDLVDLPKEGLYSSRMPISRSIFTHTK